MNPKFVDRAKGRLKHAIEVLKKTNTANHSGAAQGLGELDAALKYLERPVGTAPSCDGFARHITDQWPLKDDPEGEAVLAAVQEYRKALKS